MCSNNHPAIQNLLSLSMGLESLRNIIFKYIFVFFSSFTSMICFFRVYKRAYEVILTLFHEFEVIVQTILEIRIIDNKAISLVS